MIDYEPLCIWECWCCDKQFAYASATTPLICPFCFEVNTIQFVDNLEEPAWRPVDDAEDIDDEVEYNG
jgi:hypothetical protein